MLEQIIPKDRKGRFRTDFSEKYRRSEKALMLALAMETNKEWQGNISK